MRSQWISTTLASLCLLSGPVQADDPILPVDSQSMELYLYNAKSNIIEIEQGIFSVPSLDKNYKNTLCPWNQIGSHILTNFSTLRYVSEGSFPATYQAYEAMQNFEGFLSQNLILNPALQNAMLDYAKNALSDDYLLNSFENHQISCLLDSFNAIKNTLPEEEQTVLENLQCKSATLQRTAFLHLRGNLEEKTSSSEQIFQDGFSVFDLNTCFLPGDLAFLHGGMAPWQNRISALAEKILSLDADVVCLQEVFTEEAGFSLYEKLKENYAHFYTAIGPRTPGFSQFTFGLPSGLFIASKYHVESPVFTSFAVTGYPMNYGIFDFVIKNESTPIGHIYTTHMQSLNEAQFAEIRALELTQILNKIRDDLQNEGDCNLPHFLCGDLNIAWGSGEPGEPLIREHFFDSYNAGRSAVTAETSTCTNHFSTFYLSVLDYPLYIDDNAQIIDYALLYQPIPGYSPKSICKCCSLQTVLIPMNTWDHPETAVSDHHGLLSTIKAAKKHPGR